MKKGEKVRGSLSLPFERIEGRERGEESDVEKRAGARESALLNHEQNMFLRREILQVPPPQSSKAAAERRGEGEADA